MHSALQEATHEKTQKATHEATQAGTQGNHAAAQCNWPGFVASSESWPGYRAASIHWNNPMSQANPVAWLKHCLATLTKVWLAMLPTYDRHSPRDKIGRDMASPYPIPAPQHQCPFPRYQTSPWLRARRKRWRTLQESIAMLSFGLIAVCSTVGIHLFLH
ncbi:MAG: hypothetical protein ACRYGK_14550 [Janthinobacterium lividum]